MRPRRRKKARPYWLRRALPRQDINALLIVAALVAILSLSSCSDKSEGVPGYSGLVSQVERNKIGGDADHWIEMKNLAGEWERVGLIFGFIGDYEECLKATAGMKKVNYAREYRCVPAN